jgi:hypothetical protein
VGPCESLNKRQLGGIMNFIASLFITFTFIGQAYSSEQALSDYFKLQQPEIVKVSEEILDVNVYPFLRNDCDRETYNKEQLELRSLGEGMDVIEDIINLGEKIWTIVEAGRPTLDYSIKSANALPSSANCAFELTNWQRPRAVRYQINYRNGFGMNVVSMEYKVIYTPGGKWQNSGSYLANVSIHPSDIQVSWGFSLNATVEVEQIINLGSAEEPAAGMQISLEWDVLNPMNAVKSKEVFFVEGTGDMFQL